MNFKKLLMTIICSTVLSFLIFGCGSAPVEQSSPQKGINSENNNTAGNNSNQSNDKKGSPEKQNNEQNSKQNDETTNKTNDEQKKQEPAEEVKSYRFGDKGEKIKEIQRSLNKFNYSLPVDGFFGTKTLWAVKDFQRRNKIPVDGIVGEQTLYKLSLKPTKETMYTPPKNPETSKDTSSINTIEAFVNGKGLSSTTKYLIWVNTETRHAYVFTGEKGSWRLYRDMLCTVGKPSTPTVKGTFKVNGRGSYFRVNKNTICKYYTRFYGSYLFHSVILDNNGKIVDGRLGMKLSHGCVRLSIENAKFIYDNIPNGTTVYIN
ncbi:L,D-transpeptidase family protein [Fonticella tunisiensis]|nr:L,D-transpeptidase family protein [Fonticella tunisiensis]